MSNTKATAGTVAATETAKATTVASKEKKAPAKKVAPKKVVKKAPAKKAAPKKKVKAERKAKVISEVVSPVIATLNGLITNPLTTNEDLKSLRLELRKFVRASRGVLRGRKAEVKVEVVASTEVNA